MSRRIACAAATASSRRSRAAFERGASPDHELAARPARSAGRPGPQRARELLAQGDPRPACSRERQARKARRRARRAAMRRSGPEDSRAPSPSYRLRVTLASTPSSQREQVPRDLVAVGLVHHLVARAGVEPVRHVRSARRGGIASISQRTPRVSGADRIELAAEQVDRQRLRDARRCSRRGRC